MNKMIFLTKLFLIIKKPNIIIVSGENENLVSEIVFHVLSKRFKIVKIENANLVSIGKNKILLLKSNLEKDWDFLIKNSKKTIFIADKTVKVKLIKKLRKQDSLIISFTGQEKIEEIKDKTKAQVVSFGFLEKADISASDFNVRSADLGLDISTNFKISFHGNIVPVWLKKAWKKETIESFLSVTACALQFDFNLVEISQSFQDFNRICDK